MKKYYILTVFASEYILISTLSVVPRHGHTSNYEN